MNIVKINPCHVIFFYPIRRLKSMNGVYNTYLQERKAIARLYYTITILDFPQSLGG